MRKYSFIIVMVLCMHCIAQTVVNPVFERSDTPAFYIKRVEITTDTTYVFCSFYAEAGSWASISKDTYLRDSKSHKTFSLQKCEGLPYSPAIRQFYQNESCVFVFCFPSIVGVEQFDFIESEGERGFNIYNVNLSKELNTSYSDTELEQISEIAFAYDSSVDTDNAMLLKEYAISLYNLISYNLSMGKYAEAIRLGKIELEIREKVFGIEDSSYIESLDNLVRYYSALGNYVEAIRLKTEAIKVLKKNIGIDNINYAISLGELALFHAYVGNYSEAIRFEKETLEIKKKIFGTENFDYAQSVNNLAQYYSDYGNNAEAIRLGIEAMEISKKNLGTEHPNYATSLNNLATYNARLGNYNEAIRLETEAMEIRKRVLGTEHPDYAMALSDLAVYNSYTGNYAEAIRLGTEAMEIRKRVIGTEHPDYATSLNNLATYNSSLGNYAEAIRLGTEAMEIRKRVLGTKHPDYANSLSSLATYYHQIGNYLEAISLGTKVMLFLKRVFGTEHLDYARSLSNLATYNLDMGNYSEAIKLGTEAMEIRKRVIGTEHPDYATSLNNLATYNSSLGNYAEAIRLGTEAMEIRKRVLGTKHPDYANSLSNLGAFNFDIGNYAEDIRLETEAMEIRKRVLGTEHSDYAMSLSNLAASYSLIGNYPEAIRLATEAMEIRKRVLGTEHPDYAMSLSNLATLNSYIGNHFEAIRLEAEAMEIKKRIFGTEHPHYLISLGNLTSDYYTFGNYKNAYYYITQQIDCSRNYILKNLGELSSNYQKSLWTTQFAYTYFSSLPNLVSQYTNKESISGLYNNTCLFAKGILLNTGIEMRKLILESRDSSLIHNYNVLSTNINIYNKLIEKPIKERFMNTDSLNSVIQKQEMELACESKVYGDYTRNLSLTWKEIQRNLKEDEIAIEFLNYPLVGMNSTMYVALTLKKGYDSPHMVPLFEENQLKTIPENVYYTQTDVSGLVWGPLEEELKDVRNIYFAPSGELHRIGIEYLPISEINNIGDIYALHRLSSTRQLAVIQDETKGKNTILYGGINYDEKSNIISTDSASTKEPVLISAFTYRANVDSLSLRNSYDYLEGTKKEVDLIAEDMKQHSIPYNYFSGTDATEESFKHLDGTMPKVMHIATHGFYFTEEEAVKSQFARPEMELLTDGGIQAGRIVEQKPMTRSGLLLSGCNRTVRHEKVPDEEEDGILTAQEISTLDLRGLDLVVLSACQTGLGDIVSGEGVFGLQRGFKKAGAKTIIMSLWNVNDESTMKMMTSFYHHYLEGMSKQDAFHAAQDELRKDCSSHQERPDWAAFIMLDGVNK